MSGIPAGPFGMNLLVTAAVLLALQAVTFAVAVQVGQHSVADTAWGIGIALAAVASLLASAGYGQPARRYLLLAASVVWGLRLAAYVTWRNHGRPEDPRYRDLLSRAQGSRNRYALRSIYLLQAAILWLACLPVQVGMLERAPAGPVTVIGAAVWLGGFVFESAGDWQLARFKSDPGNEGLIMDRGLWRYTRHPNYFGDFCMWWGLFLIALGSWAELPTAVGPLLMTVILTRGTGQRLTDRRMAATRPQYADYAARTSGFIPRPPRKTFLPNGTWFTPQATSQPPEPARRWIGGTPPPRGFHAARRPCRISRRLAQLAAVRRLRLPGPATQALRPRAAAEARPGTAPGTSVPPATEGRRRWRSGPAAPPAR